VGDVGDRKIPDRLAAFQLEVACGEGLVRRLLRRMGEGGQRQPQAGGDETGDAFHVLLPEAEGL